MSSSTIANNTDKSQQENPVWIHAWDDALANACAQKSCMCFSDINGNSDYKLCIAQSYLNPLIKTSVPEYHKLRVFRGTGIAYEIPLLEEPCSLKSYYQDYKAPRLPILAVASGSSVYLLKNLQPYYHFKLPEMQIDNDEKAIWEELKQGKMDVLKAINDLRQIKDKGILITKRSLEFLSLDNGSNTIEQREDLQLFVEERKDFPLKQISSITCMEVLKKDKDEEDCISCLVLGTEDSQVLILEPTGTKIAKTFTLPSVPVTICTNGKLDVEYRIIVSCRNGNIYTIKNGQVSGLVIELESQATDMLCSEKTIFIATMNDTIHCYHARSGKKQYSIYLPCGVKDMEILDMKGSRNVSCLIVALENFELRVYNGKQLINTIKTADRICGMRFGIYGSETNTLGMTFSNGGLSFKFLARTAKLEGKTQTGPPEEQNIPLNLPKRTKLYLEQTNREKEYAVEMHRIFQRDLCKLRLTTAKSFVKILTDGQGPLSYASGSNLRLNAQVQGLGPNYKIRLSMQNSGQSPLHGIPILVQYDQNIYTVKKPLFTLPALIPNVPYKFTIDISLTNPDEGVTTPINLFVCNPGSSIPLITAVVEMSLQSDI